MMLAVGGLPSWELLLATMAGGTLAAAATLRATHDVQQIVLVQLVQGLAGGTLGERPALLRGEARAKLRILPGADDGLCVHGLPLGWEFSGVKVPRGGARSRDV